MNEQPIAKLWERAVAAEQREDWAEAERLYRRIADAAPKHAPTFQRLGLVALRRGRPADAVGRFRSSLAIEPADPVCLNNLGNVLRELGRLRESVSAYRQALDHQPNYASALFNLAGTLALLEDDAKAVEVYRDLLRLEPNDAEAWNALGLSLLEIGEEAESKKALQEALRLKPNDAKILNELGVAHQFEGDLESAARLFLASIEADPEFARAYDNFVRSRRMNTDDLHLVEPIERIAGDKSQDYESRLIAHFALGKIYDDCGERDKAFESYAAGNALKHRLVKFDPSAHAAWVDRVLREFDEDFFRAHAGEGNPSTRPVFVVGMIRSGTSLVEQILSSHSQVHGAGELLEITNLITGLPVTLGTREKYPECIRELDAGAIQTAADKYLRSLAGRNDQAQRVVDKLPTNFLHLGFIAAILPNARIVHCRRQPLDVCLSIYFQRFARGHDYAYDFDDIATYYAEYERLMRHWKRVLPMEIHDVCYEHLLDDIEKESRRMLTFCDLDWEYACLAFHRSKRPVRTASSWQVRQPLYRSAMARWRKFEPHLESLKKALSNHAVHWDSAE
jgi:tetratricopeptide (TPR) repeat protein